MHIHLKERVAYGRQVRAEADTLLAQHGRLAGELATSIAVAPGLAESERAFRQAVAARVVRFVRDARQDAGH